MKERSVQWFFYGWIVLTLVLTNLLLYFDWGYGRLRSLIVLAIALLVVGFYRLTPLWQRASYKPSKDRTKFAKILAVTVFILCGFGILVEITIVFQQGRISLDQGISSYNANRLWQQGRNPYESQNLVDTYPYEYYYRDYLSKMESPPSPPIPPSQLEEALNSYTQTLDVGLLERLLPYPYPEGNLVEMLVSPSLTAPGLGYKYGPLILYLERPFVGWFGIAGVGLVVGVFSFALLVGVWLLLQRLTDRPLVVAIGLLAIALDPFIRMNFLLRTATDLFALVFILYAVVAWLDGRRWLVGLLLGFALASKIAPTIAVLPLLLTVGPVGIAIFVVTLVSLCLPWMEWNLVEFLRNYLFWPLRMEPDGTSWQPLDHGGIALALQLALISMMAAVWLWFLWRYFRAPVADRLRNTQAILPITLCLSAIFLSLSGKTLHNNYVPWFSLWFPMVVIALVYGKNTLATLQIRSNATK